MENSLSENTSKDEEEVKIPINVQVKELREEYRKLVEELMSRQLELEKTNSELHKEKELAESQLQKHVDFYNYAPSGYFTLNREGIILELNQSASRFLGGQVDQLKGNRFSDFLHEDSLLTFSDFLSNVFETPLKISCKVALQSPYNVPVSVLIEGISLPNGFECLIDMVDISGRMKILYQLAESEMRYQQLLENLNEGIGIVDLDEVFTYANPAGELIFGVSPGELRNHSLQEFLSIDQYSLIQAESEKRGKGEKSRYELDIITPKGEKKTIYISGSPNYNKEGKRIGTFGMFTDITDKKNDERELQRRLKLELILSEISNDFVHLKREYLDHSVNRAIQKIGSFAGVDRSYIFLFSDDGLFCNNTHEWCAEGIESQIDNLKDVPLELMPWWMDKIKKFETIHIPLVADLPSEAQAEKEILEAQDIKSLLVIPLLTSDSVVGFIGFDSVAQVKEWQDQDILLLSMLGEILGNGFGRMKYEEDLVSINTRLELKVEERTRDITKLLELNRAIVDNVGLMVISTDPNGIIKSFNPFAEKMLGYEAKDVIGKCTPLIFHDPDEIKTNSGADLSGVEQFISENFGFLTSRNLNQDKSNNGNEWTFVSKDGRKINVLLTVSELEDEQGNTLGFVGVAIDITGRKLAEEQLRISENENKAIISAVPDMLFRIRRDGTFLDFHHQSSASQYVSKENFLGKTINEVLPPELAKKSMKELENAFLTKEVTLYEYQLQVKDEDHYYENRIVAISESEALSIIRDITDRKLTEEALRTSTQNLTILIQNLHAGTLFEDETRHIYMVNQSFCNLFGIDAPPDALVGFDCAVASENSKHMMKEPVRFIERIDEIILAGKTVTSDELYLNDGRVFERDYIPISDNNDLLGHLWQYHDITDRKLNERYAIIQRDLGFNLAATTSLEQALSLVIQSSLLIEEIHAVGVYLIDQHTGNLDLILHEGFSKEFVESVRCYTHEHVQFEIVMKGEPVYRFYNEIFENSELFTYDNLKQIGVIPIKHEGHIIGSVNIASRSTERFKYAAQISVEIIASQIGGTLARINMENALKLSQLNFHLMFDTIGDFMFILDAEGKIIKTNPVVEQRLGYTPEELHGMSVLQVHPPARREEAAFIVSEMLAGRLEVCPVPLYKKNGDTIAVETKVVYGKWDGADALYGISRDISERLKAEESLRESEERWHFALEGSGDGVWDWNILTNEVFYTKQWKSMLGYDVNEIEDKLDEWENRVYPDDLQNCLVDLNKHFNGETEVYINEHRMLCKDGNYKWILDRGKVVEWTNDGKPMRIIGTHSDITPRKLFEEQLRKAIEKEKELNELKSRFVSTASHEFRTPLATILMLSDTLISHQQKMDQEKIAARLEKIKNNVLHLTNIVNDVLQLSKMHEGKIGFNPVEDDLVSLCVDIIEGFNSAILVNGQITFKTLFKSVNINLDNRLIVQSISNLISNAIKYSEGNPVVKINLGIEGDELLLSITDNGIGIPEEDQKHLFTPFFRAGNSSTIQGNGLGLSIVNESIQMHGGKVTFISGIKQGSTFTIHLPEGLICSYSLVD